MLSENLKVEIVYKCYRDAIGKPFMVTKDYVPTARRAVIFFDTAQAKKVFVYDLMVAAVKCYGEAWCRQTFGRPYPPLAIALSEKCLNKALSQTVQSHGVSMERNLERYKSALAGFDKDTARELVEAGGFCGGREDIKEALLKELI